MSGPLRLGLVGLDHWYSAIPLAEAVAADPRTEVAVIADRSLGRAQEVAALAGGRATASYDDVLADESIDVVASFVSVDENPDVCVAAAAARKHGPEGGGRGRSRRDGRGRLGEPVAALAFYEAAAAGRPVSPPPARPRGGPRLMTPAASIC